MTVNDQPYAYIQPKQRKGLTGTRWWFRIRCAGNHEILASSEVYKSKAAMLSTVSALSVSHGLPIQGDQRMVENDTDKAQEPTPVEGDQSAVPPEQPVTEPPPPDAEAHADVPTETAQEPVPKRDGPLKRLPDGSLGRVP